jgi:SAM-dependent methyltransferase
MMTFSGLKATFDSAAEMYTVARPGYPDALIRAVVELSGVPERGRILEIGCGTGQATAPFAERGYELLCLEPGAQLAAAAAERFRSAANVAIEVVTFEDWPVPRGAFDLVVSAQAFHWIDPDVGLPKAAAALRSTGALALFWNLPVDEPATSEGRSDTALMELSPAIQQQYQTHAPELMHERQTNRLSAQVAELEARLRGRTGLFREVATRRFPWTERYDADRYVALLSTYSGHIALPADRRQRLLGGIAHVIRQNGGVLVKPYVAVLFVAKVQGPGGRAPRCI